MEIVINKEFEFTPENIDITPNMALVAKSFAIPLNDAVKLTLFKNFKLNIPETGIVYIHGQSGSGKSVLLSELRERLAENSVFLDDIQLDRQKAVVDYLGLDFEKTLYWFSQIGLNEAFIMLRQAGQLSDGQVYRAKLAMALSGYQTIFIDEFCANLDRVTAKIVSYNLRKVVDRNKKLVIVATTHDDLKGDLQPDVEVRCVYGEKPAVES